MVDSLRTVAFIDWTLIHDRIDDLDRRARDLGRVFKRLIRPMGGDQRDHDKKNEGPEGKWPARSAATEAKRRKVARLKRRNKAMRTIALAPAKKIARSVPRKLLGRLPRALKITSGSMSVKAASRATDFGGAHNQGAMVGRKRRVKLPRREFIWLSDHLIAYATFEIGTAVLGEDW